MLESSVCVDSLGELGGFRQEFDGAQDYDFIFRCTEQAKEIVHIPQVLYCQQSGKQDVCF